MRFNHRRPARPVIRTLVELVFGMPGPELFEAAEQESGAWRECITCLNCESPKLTCNLQLVGFELYGQLFENDLVGVMNAHAQHGSELFLQANGLSYFIDDKAEAPPGWNEMLATMTDAFGELVEHATTVRREADTAENLPSEFGHPLDRHPELRLRAERCLELMRQRLVGLALAVIAAHAEASDTTAVEMATGSVRRREPIPK